MKENNWSLSRGRFSTNFQRGFTLIELLVVVLIIGILSAVALPQYEKAVAKSRMAGVQTTADALKKGLNVYYLANGKFTTDISELDVELPENITRGQSGANGKGIYTGWSSNSGNTLVISDVHTKDVGLEVTGRDGHAEITACISPYSGTWADNKKTGDSICNSLGFTKNNSAGTCSAFTGNCRHWTK